MMDDEFQCHMCYQMLFLKHLAFSFNFDGDPVGVCGWCAGDNF